MLLDESIEEVLARVFISQSTPSFVHPHHQNIKSALWEMSYQTPEYEESRKRRRVSFAADKNQIGMECNSRELLSDQTIDSSLSVEVIDLDEVQGSSILSQLLQEFEKPIEETPPHSFENCSFGEAEEEIETILNYFHPSNGSTSRLIESFETLIQVLTDRARVQSDRDNLKAKVLAKLGEYRRTVEKSLFEGQLQTQKVLDMPSNRSSQIEIDLTKDGSDVLLSQSQPLIPSSSHQFLKHAKTFSLNGRNEQPYLTNEGSYTYSLAKATKEYKFVQDETDDIFAKLEQRQLEMQYQKTLRKSEPFFEGSILNTSTNQTSSIIQQELRISQLSSVQNLSDSTDLPLLCCKPFSHPVQISNPSSNLDSHVHSSSHISGGIVDNTDWAAVTDEELKVMADQYGLRFENRPKLISLLRQMAAKFQALTDQTSSSSTSGTRNTKARALGLQELKKILESESDLYQQILCFMPVSFEEIYGRIQNKGFYTTKEQLLPLLDSLAIFVSTSAPGHVGTSKRKRNPTM